MEQQLIKEQRRLAKIPKPHLCLECGEDNPDNFYSHYKSQCKLCNNKKSREFTRQATIERNKDKPQSFYSQYPILDNRFTNAQARATLKSMDFDLTRDWMLEQFNNQDGRCAYSNVPMDVKNKGPLSASLDRIDSTKGYTQENCQLVTTFIQRCKYNYSEEEFIDLLMLTVDGIK